MNVVAAIRRATTGDRAFVRDLGRRVAATSVSSLRPGSPALVEEAYDRLVDYVLTRDHAILIAESDIVLGFAMVVFDLPEEITLSEQAFVAYMAVEPAYQRRGVGRALLEGIELVARQRGIPHVSLMVTEENAAALTLYANAGFVTERRLMTKTV
jgi:ribosomal protein S18 acetylase RimI-like enzyme